MRSYEAARGLFNFLGVCSWGLILLGGVIAFGAALALSATGFGRGASGLQLLMAALPGIGLLVTGLFGLVLVQTGRAGVDTAEYSQQALQVARDQLEISRRTLEQGQQLALSYSALAHPSETTAEAAASDTSWSDHAGKAQAEPQEAEKAEPRPLPRAYGDQRPSTSPASTPPPTLASAPIEQVVGGFRVGEKLFQTEAMAKAYVAQLTSTARS